MRACMGYLDYINKKHNRERRIQIIRNKISGFVLLTIVFLLIFGLSLVMTFFLGRAFTKVLKKKTIASYEVNELIFSKNNSTSTLSPFSSNLVPSILQSEHMVTAPTKPAYTKTNNTVSLSDAQSCELIKQTLRTTLLDLIKRTNLSRVGMENLARDLTKNFFNSTIVEMLNTNQPSLSTVSDLGAINGDIKVDGVNNLIEEVEEEETSSHYFELIDELN